MKNNPFKAIFSVKKEELPFSLLMSFYFFLVITSFWILKPLKKSLFIDYYKIHEGFNLLNWHLLGSQAELIAKILNMFVAAIAVIVFTVLVRWFFRQQLTTIFSIFCIVSYFLFMLFLPSVNKSEFSLETEFQGNLDLEQSPPNDLIQVFENHDITISPTSSLSVVEKDKLWRIADEGNKRIYTIRREREDEKDKLNVYLTQSGKDWSVWLFYLFGDLFSTLMVATFFAFLNDSVTSDRAKRLYGLIGFGGVAGGAFGTMALALFIKTVPNTGWMLILVGIGVLIIGVALIAGKKVKRLETTREPKEIAQDAPKATVNPAFEGAKLVLASKYLLAIVGIVGLYEMVSTIMDFQFTSSVEHYVTGSTRSHFSIVYTITNFVAMFVQLFLTSFVMTRFRVGIALLILPIAALAGSAGFLFAPILLLGSALNTTDNGFSYSINQSAKEALYVPTSKDEKYKAKAFIDMFVQRFAKTLAVGLSLLITTIFTTFGAIRWLSLLTAAILVVWIFAARYAGRRFEALTQSQT